MTILLSYSHTKLIMIIPIRCSNCNKLIAGKYREYQRRMKDAGIVKDTIITVSKENAEDIMKDTPQMKIFDDLGIERICCRRHFLAQVDILESQAIVKDARQIPE